jgi:hypothetical protein
MNKAINIENTGKSIERVLSIINEEDMNFNPTGLNYILITDYTEPPELQTPLSKNYAMYDKVNGVFKWVPVQYQNTATEEILQIENLKAQLEQEKSKRTEVEQQLSTAKQIANETSITQQELIELLIDMEVI